MPLPAATTRSPGGTLCEAPLYVLLKHPSRRRSDPWGFVLGRWVAARALGALGVGCAAGSPRGRWVLRWVFQGGDDEVHRPDTLRGVSGRSPEAPPAPASRLAEAHFWALGVWALGDSKSHHSTTGRDGGARLYRYGRLIAGYDICTQSILLTRRF